MPLFEGAKFSRKFVVLLDINVSKTPKSPDHFLKVSVRVFTLLESGRRFLDLSSNKITNSSKAYIMLTNVRFLGLAAAGQALQLQSASSSRIGGTNLFI